MKDQVLNKLTERQYEHAVSWSTSIWLAPSMIRGLRVVPLPGSEGCM